MSAAPPAGSIVLLGLGVENRAVAAWLAHHGASFAVADARHEAVPVDAAWREAVTAVHSGEGYLDALGDYDIAIRSPGLHALHPSLTAAAATGTTITSQTALFLDRCPSPVIGITGTKGKGTTATLLSSMLEAAGEPHRLGGNIGVPPLGFLDELTGGELVVLELSSFQLQDLRQSPSGAVVLPVGTDHLDVHGDRNEYVQAKSSLTRYQSAGDWVVYPADCATATQLAALSAGRRVAFAARPGASRGEGAWGEGIWIEDDTIVARTGDEQTALAPVAALALKGRHNLGNACAASAAAWLGGVSPAAIEAGLRACKPLPHRLEEVATVDGVLYVNDSLGTTPAAAAAAIETYSGGNLVVIAGGAGKGTAFDEMGDAIARHAKALIVIGEEGPAVARAAESAGYDGAVVTATSLAIAVAVARRLSAEGGVVLLAPGCASFGMFANYAERGEAFRAAVREIEASG